MNGNPKAYSAPKTISRVIAGLVLAALLSTNADASELYIIHHFRDAICRTSPCPNWSGIEQKTGAEIQFDVLTEGRFASPARQARFDRESRAGNVLVEGSFAPIHDRSNVNWSSRFELIRIIRICATAEDCR